MRVRLRRRYRGADGRRIRRPQRVAWRREARFYQECQRCLHRYWRDEPDWCPKCGSPVTTLLIGRVSNEEALTEAAARPAPIVRRRMRARLARRAPVAKVLKIRKRVAEEEEAPVRRGVKAAQPGSRATGGRIEKLKEGSKSTKGAGSGRFIGRTSGMGVAKYQNHTILSNRKQKLTDEELAADWRKEFPNARAEYTADTVRSVRNLVNLGKHANPDQIPNPPIPEYDDEGNALPFHGQKAAEKRAAREERTSARPSKTAPVKGKVVKRGR